MTRIKLILLGVLAVLAVSAVASASASAACTKEVNSKFILCLGEPLALTEGTLTIHVETDPSTGGKYVLKTGAVEVLCTVVEGLGALTSLSAPKAPNNGVQIVNLLLKFSKCTVNVPAKCTVTEPIATEYLLGVIKAKEDVVFSPLGEVFATIVFKNKGTETCVIAGTDKVKVGKEQKNVLCTSPTEVTRELQLFTCAKENTELNFLNEVATFEGNFNVKLLSAGAAAKWAVIEGK